MNNRRGWTTGIAVCAIVLGLTACGSSSNGSGSGNVISSSGAPNASSPAAAPSEEPTTVIAPQSSAASPESQPVNASEPANEALAQASEAPSDELTKQRIRMLERAFGATTPEQAAKTWAEARYKRNGAMEYAVLDPATREKQLKQFEEMNWVTGVSSPWIARYRIGKGEKQADGSYRFSVQFDYRTSQDAEKKIEWSEIPADDITVRKNGDNDEFWYVAP